MYYNKQRERGIPSQTQCICLLIFKKRTMSIGNGLFVHYYRSGLRSILVFPPQWEENYTTVNSNYLFAYLTSKKNFQQLWKIVTKKLLVALFQGAFLLLHIFGTNRSCYHIGIVKYRTLCSLCSLSKCRYKNIPITISLKRLKITDTFLRI